MKYIVCILFFICAGVTAKAQLPSSTFPSRIFNGNTKAQWILLDSPVVNPILDTFYARYPGTQLVRIQGGDTAFWFGAGGHLWFRGLLNRDTISLSNRINLKLNISDTIGAWLAQSSRLVDTMYSVNDSTIGYTIKGSPYTFQILGRSQGAPGSGLTSVGLSMPSAFSVSGSPLTSNGTINVSGAGTTLEYIRGNGTLATTDTGMIPNYYLKVRGLLTGTSPITFNQITGAIGINNANTTGTKGAASFTSAFSDNGSGLIDIADVGSSGSCTNCNVTYNSKGQATSFSSGVGPTGSSVDTIFRTPGIDSIYFTINSVQYAIKDSSGNLFSNNNTGSGYRWVATPTGNIKTFYTDITGSIDSTSNSNGLTYKVDTSYMATQYDLMLVNNGLSKRGDTTQLGALTNTGSPLNHNTWINTGVFALTTEGTNPIGDVFVVNNTGTGSGLRGTSIDSYGISGTSTNLYGVYGTSTNSHAIQGWTTNGNTAGYLENTASSTNTVTPTLQIKRTTSGTAASGIGSSIEYYIEKDNGANNTPSHTLRSILTNPANGAEVGQFEIYGVNNAVLSRKMAITGTGQQIWDGYPALTAQVDTATYKPVAIDGSGNVVKMIGWAGSGGASITFPDGLLASSSNTPRVAKDSDVVNTLNQYPSLHNSIYCLPTDSVIFVGDSYTYGTGATNPALKFSSWLSRSIGAVEVNLGVPGSTISKRTPVDPFGGTNLIDRLSTIPHNSFKIKLLIISMGLNDVGMANAANYTTTNYKSDYDSAMNYITGTLGYTPQKILIISPWYIGYTGYVSYSAANLGNGLPTVARHLQFVDATQQTATKWRAMYFDIYQDQIKNDTTLFSVDGIHPDDGGYLYIANDFKQYLNSAGNLILGDYNAFSVSNPTNIDLGTHYSNDPGNPSQLKLYLYRDWNTPGLNFGLEVASATMGYHAGGSSTYHRWYINDNVQRMRLGQDGLLVGSNVSTFGTTTPIYLDLGGTFTTVVNDTSNMKFRLYSVVSNGAAGMNLSSNDGSLTGNMEYMAAYNMRHVWYRGPKELMRIDTSGNLIINSTTDNHVGRLQVNGKLTVATHDIGSNSDSAVVWDRSTKEYKVAKINGGSGITSINSQTGSSITLAADNGLTATTTTNTVTYTLGGTLTGFTQIAGGTNSLVIGTSGSHLSGFTTYGDAINLFGNVRYGTEDYSTDANHTIASTATFEELHDVLTTDRTITMPSASQQGQTLTIITRFSAGSNHFNLASAITDNSTGSTFTQLDWGKRYDFYVNSSLAWILISKY